MNYCPASRHDPCYVGTLGVPSLPPGACGLLWETSVANVNSVAVLASGPDMHTVAGKLSHGAGCCLSVRLHL